MSCRIAPLFDQGGGASAAAPGAAPGSGLGRLRPGAPGGSQQGPIRRLIGRIGQDVTVVQPSSFRRQLDIAHQYGSLVRFR